MLLPLLPSPPPPYLPAMHVARLSSRAVVRVSGPDARAFLHVLVTQDVENTLIPWMQPKLSVDDEDVPFMESILRPLFNAEKQ